MCAFMTQTNILSSKEGKIQNKIIKLYVYKFYVNKCKLSRHYKSNFNLL